MSVYCLLAQSFKNASASVSAGHCGNSRDACIQIGYRSPERQQRPQVVCGSGRGLSGGNEADEEVEDLSRVSPEPGRRCSLPKFFEESSLGQRRRAGRPRIIEKCSLANEPAGSRIRNQQPAYSIAVDKLVLLL